MHLSCFEMDHGSSNSLNAGAYSGPSGPPPWTPDQGFALDPLWALQPPASFSGFQVLATCNRWFNSLYHSKVVVFSSNWFFCVKSRLKHCIRIFFQTNLSIQAPVSRPQKLFPQLLVLQGKWLENPLALQQNLPALHFCMIMSSPDWQIREKCGVAYILYLVVTLCCFDTRTIIIIIILC